MKKSLSKLLSAVLAGAVMTTTVMAAEVTPAVNLTENAVIEAAAETVNITDAAGWLESAYVEWSSFSSASGFAAYVKEAGAADSAYVRLDNELIRKYPTYFRADAVGLKAGDYVIKVVPYVNGALDEGAAAVSKTLTVKAHDRSGFAFSSKSKLKTASGAYNDDGTLRSNAKVFYVTKDTAKTIQADLAVDSKGTTNTFTGLQDIIAAKQKGYDTTPLDFRIIGTIEKNDLDRIDSSSEGLQIKGKNVQSDLSITIEGIGEDAGIRGFGMLLRNAGNVELRNFAVMLCMDDCISIDTDNANIWVHNLDLFYGNTGGDADQAKGDGTIDMKGDSQYVTISYNHLWDSGKASLCGMKSESGPNYITYHHNWFDHSDSRHPRIRTMSVHVYNNFYDGNAKYGVGAAYKSSAFVENNVFENCKHPMLISRQGSDIMENEKTGAPDFSAKGTFSGEDGGIIKAYNNTITGSDGNEFGGGAEPVYYNAADTQTNGAATQFDAYLASSRDEQVPASVSALQGGKTFDNESLAVSNLNATPESVDTVKATVTKYAGRVNGSDFLETLGKSKSDFVGLSSAESDAVDTELKASLSSYKSTLVSVGGMTTGGDVETTESKSTESTTETTTSNVESSTVTTETTTAITETITETTTETTTATTESTTETTTLAQNVEMGQAQPGFASDDANDTGAGTSVTYNQATGFWDLKDTSGTAAAELTLPFAEQTSGKVTISGKAVPSVQGSKWMFVQIKGKLADGTEDEIVAFGGGSAKTDLSVRANKGSYIKLADLTAGTVYSYEIVIDIDAKTADITVNGSNTTLTGIDATSLTALYTVTSKTGQRDVSITVPYVNNDSIEVPVEEYVVGDTNANGVYEASDAAEILQKALDAAYVTALEEKHSNVSYIDLFDVDGDKSITASDSSIVLQKVLDSAFVMPCEKK